MIKTGVSEFGQNIQYQVSYKVLVPVNWVGSEVGEIGVAELN